MYRKLHQNEQWLWINIVSCYGSWCVCVKNMLLKLPWIEKRLYRALVYPFQKLLTHAETIRSNTTRCENLKCAYSSSLT